MNKNLECMTYTEILKEVGRLSIKPTAKSIKIVVLSNIVVNQIKELLEYIICSNNVNVDISFTDYDTIVQSSYELSDSDIVIIFWELSNIFDGTHFKAEMFDKKQLSAFIDDMKTNINTVFENCKNNPIVIFNSFCSIHSTNFDFQKNNLDLIADKLNTYLMKFDQPNFNIVNMDKIISHLGISTSIDNRLFYLSKILYTIPFLKSYVNHIKPILFSTIGLAKKALIFDCDNTLWKGILGEDGFENIQMSTNTKHGYIFSEIQSIALTLESKGVLLGLCSKNNFEDVMGVVNSHPDMQLKEHHLSIIRVNWEDKVSNLQSISSELNIGCDCRL